MAGGVFAHTFLIGMQTVQAGHAPLVGTSSAISAFVWLLGLAYLYIELSSDERSMGAFVAVLMVGLDIIPALDPGVAPRPAVLQSPLFTVHVMSLLLAYASFALACVLGVTYALLFKEIKAKQLGFFYARLPPLASLDLMNSRAITVGWVFLTIGVVIGGIWAWQVQGSPDPRAQAMVKPALAYLDVIAKVKAEFGYPTAAYHECLLAIQGRSNPDAERCEPRR